MSSDLAETPTSRRALIFAAIAVLALALVVAFVAGKASKPSDEAAGPAAATTSATTPTGSPTQSPSLTPATSATPTVSTAPPASVPGSAIEQGRTSDFGYTKTTETTAGYVHLRFDRAILLFGKAANDYAAAHGQATPVTNDYLIINDNKQLRDLVLAKNVVIKGRSGLTGSGETASSPVTVDVFLAKVKANPNIPLQLTYDKNRQVTVIEEPFFP